MPISVPVSQWSPPTTDRRQLDVSAGAVPGGAVPGGAVPDGAVAGGAVPDGAVADGAVPDDVGGGDAGAATEGVASGDGPTVAPGAVGALEEAAPATSSVRRRPPAVMSRMPVIAAMSSRQLAMPLLPTGTGPEVTPNS